MSGFQLFADLVGSLAWPVAALLMVWFLRTPLGRLLDRIKAVKGLGGEVNFSEQREAVAEAAADLIQPSDFDSFLNNFMQRHQDDPPEYLRTRDEDIRGRKELEGGHSDRTSVDRDSEVTKYLKLSDSARFTEKFWADLVTRQAESRRRRQEAVEDLVKSAVGLGAIAQDEDPLDPPIAWGDQVVITWLEDKDLPTIAVRTQPTLPGFKPRKRRAEQHDQ